MPLKNIFFSLTKNIFKIYETESFREWGVTEKCSIFYFENGIPNIYSGKSSFRREERKVGSILTFSGDVSNDRELLKWVKRQFEGDDIEDVNGVVLEKIAKGQVGDKQIFGEHEDAAVLFCKL